MNEKRTEVLRLAMTPTEIQTADRLAYSYGLTLPEFARVLFRHAAMTKPELAIQAAPRRPGRPAKRYSRVRTEAPEANGHPQPAK